MNGRILEDKAEDILFISDLDGTLLDENAELSNYTREKLAELIGKGLNFTVSTARTAATAKKILAGLPLCYPVILMSGTLTYDMKNDRYTDVKYIDSGIYTRLCEILNRHSLTGFVYTLENGEMLSYYENLDEPHLKAFHDERVRKYGKKFIKTESFSSLSDKGVIYFSTSDTAGRLMDCAEELKAVGGINVEYYRDIYVENHMYLEVSDSRASKYDAAAGLRSTLNFKRLCSFGDNLNDLPMFRACDYNCAVGNAKDDVKAAADLIIGTNREDGVVRYLERFMKM